MTRHSHQVFDSKAPRGLVQRVGEALGWSDSSVKGSGPEGGKSSVQQSVQQSGPEGGFEGGKQSGFNSVQQLGNAAGPKGVQQSGEPSGVELHVVDGRLIACRPGEPPPLSVRQHTQAFLDWLRAHDKVPGNEVPVAVLEDVLYWDFLRDTGLPMKSWRTVSDILAKLPGVKKYQADWRDPTGEGSTPVVFKVSKRRRAKVVHLAAAKRERA